MILKAVNINSLIFSQDGIINIDLDRKSFKMPDPPEGTPNPFADSMTNILRAFQAAVGSWGEDYAIYSAKINKWNPKKLITGFTDVAEPMKCGLQILNHGDVWVNNFMVKYDEDNNPIDILMIDFQTCFWASPTIDLQYFFVSSLQDDIKVDHFDELIKYYHTELVNNLKMLNYEKPVPTLKELHEDLLEKGFFGACCMMFIMFICKYDSEKEITLDMLFKGGDGSQDLLNEIYSNDCYITACKKWLPFLNDRGCLDGMY